MLPFLEDEELALLAKKIMESDTGEYKGVSLDEVLPFLDEDVVDEAFLYQVQKGQDYRSLLPFVSEEALHKLAVKYVRDELIVDIDMDELYPFMDDDDIRLIFRHELEK